MDEFRDLAHRWVAERVEESKRFAKFRSKYDAKIKSKIKQARGKEDVIDFVVELHVAYKLLDNPQFDVTWEPKIADMPRSPDYFVNCDQPFYIEFKHIRQIDTVAYGEEVVNEFGKMVQERKSPLSLHLEIAYKNMQLGMNPHDLVQSIAPDCHALIDRYKIELRGDKQEVWTPRSVPWMQISFQHSKNRPADSLTILETCGGEKIPCTTKEPLNFIDKIMDSLSQLPPSFPNVLILHINSDTHDPRDLHPALAIIEDYVKEENDDFFQRKHVNGLADYLELIKRLSTIVVTTRWEVDTSPQDKILIWHNSSASKHLGAEKRDFLRDM